MQWKGPEEPGKEANTLLKSGIHTVNELFSPFVCRFNSTFKHVNRTLCAVDLTDSNKTLDTSPLFYVDVFSSSSENISYNIRFEPVESFSLQ